MEIFMAKVDFFASNHDVTRAIANKLHVPEYTISMPVNFHVRLFRDKRGRRQHGGCGILTLPTVDLGQRFLSRYGERGPESIRVNNRPIVLKPSTQPRPISNGILTSIQNSPYLDPETVEQRERVADILRRRSVAIRRVQFGWDCRDYVFSIEWEHDCPEGSRLIFISEKPQVAIRIAGPAFPGSSPQQAISMDFSQIYDISACYANGEAVIFFSLSTPPSYLTNSILADSTKEPPQRRFSALDLHDIHARPHAEVAPYTSLYVRLVCSSTDAITTFTDLVETAGLNLPIDNHYYPVERRGLFSRHALERFSQWLTLLPFNAAFVIQGLVNQQAVDPTEIMVLEEDIDGLVRDARDKGDEYMFSVLRDFGHRATSLYWNTDRPTTLRQCFKETRRRYDRPGAQMPLVPKRDGEDLFMCLHLIVTPTSTFLEGPLPERSNRVIRSYRPENRSNFIRVSFVDEGKLRFQYDRDIDLPNFVQRRVGSILLDGLDIAGRRFNFLAYSQSALKEHAVWFLKPFVQDGISVDVPHVIDSLGSFSDLAFDPNLMLCPARYAARISQGFTATDPTTIQVNDIQQIDDIMSTDRKWNFTDGVGTMSSEMARSVHLERRQQKRGRKLPYNDYPRALQVRFMGSKGVLSVDHTLTGTTVCLRPSMIKFSGTRSNTIEIAKVFDKPGRMYLNRPLIMLLEGLGVNYEAFKKHQDEAVHDAQESTESLDRAAHFLEGHGLGSSFRLPSVFTHLSKLDANLPTDPFFDKMMEFAVNHVLRLLKHKARIPIDGAYNLVGVADVHRYLEEGQVFVCVKPIDGSRKFLEGEVLVSRSPTIHPGDVQIVHAIGTPPPDSPFSNEPLNNTVVFSTQGSRPLPSCLGGGDLDGDEYNIIPLATLPEFRPGRFASPSQYSTAPRKELPQPCVHDDIARFVMDYITSDVLGYVSITWRILADQRLEGIFDPDCLKLADLHSLAVDYPKSGRPVPMDDIPKRPKDSLPDWHAPETMTKIDPTRYYPSQRAIGKLFRDIDLPATSTATGMGRAQRKQFMREIHEEDDVDDLTEAFSHTSLNELDNPDPSSVQGVVKRRVEEFIDVDDIDLRLVETISDIFIRYRSQLQISCSTHTLSQNHKAMLTEEEAIIGTIVANTSQPRKRADHIAKLREETDILVRGVRENLAGSDEVSNEDALMNAYLAFRLASTFSHGHKKRRAKFGANSFAWIALGAIFEAIREIEEEQMEQERQLYRRR